jgi:hypothetical protein
MSTRKFNIFGTLGELSDAGGAPNNSQNAKLRSNASYDLTKKQKKQIANARAAAEKKYPANAGGVVGSIGAGDRISYHATIGYLVNASSASSAMAAIRRQLEGAGWQNVSVTSGGTFSTDLFITGTVTGSYKDNNAVRSYLDSVASAAGFSVDTASSTVNVSKGGGGDAGADILRSLSDALSSPTALIALAFVGILILKRK